MEISPHRRDQNSLLSPRGFSHKPSFGSENRYSEDEEVEIYNILPAKVISTTTASKHNSEHQNHFQDPLKTSIDLNLEESQGEIFTQVDRSSQPKRRYSITGESSYCCSKKNSKCPECNIF